MTKKKHKWLAPLTAGALAVTMGLTAISVPQNNTYAQNLSSSEVVKLAAYNEETATQALGRDSFGVEYWVKHSDSATIFNEIITRKDSLECNADILEQLESFYKTGSSQQKVFNDALEIVKWYYQNNTLLNDLSKLSGVISDINTILKMPVPFSKMNQLSQLVFQAGEVKDQILEEKYQEVLERFD